MRAAYEYYLQYKKLMYGDDVWIVPYERFVAQYPFWCPAHQFDLEELAKKLASRAGPQFNKIVTLSFFFCNIFMV